MSSENIAVRVQNFSECYQIYDNPRDRLKQFVVPKLCRVFPLLRRFFHTSVETFSRIRELSRSFKELSVNGRAAAWAVYGWFKKTSKRFADAL